MAISFNSFTDGVVAPAATMNANFTAINSYLAAGLVVSELRANYYRSQMVFTIEAPANGVDFDFGTVMLPPIAQYAVCEGISIGCETITANDISANFYINGTVVTGTATVSAAGTAVYAGLTSSTIPASAQLKVRCTGTFTGVKKLTVVVFLKQILKEA